MNLKNKYVLMFFLLILSVIQAEEINKGNYSTEKKGIPSKEFDIFIGDILNDAFKLNPNLLSKRNSQKASLELEDSARWEYYPTPSISSEYDNNSDSVISLKVDQPLFAGGRIDATYEQSKLDTKIKNIEIYESKQTLGLSISNSINELIKMYGRILVYEESIKNLETYYQMIQRRVNMYVSTITDLTLVENRIVQAKTNIYISKINLEKSLNLLSQYLAKDISIETFERILPKEFCGLDNFSFYKNQDLIQSSIKYSPAVKKYELEIRKALKNVDLKKSSFYPTVLVRAEKNFYNNSSDNDEYSLKIVLDYTMGSGLSAISNLNASKMTVNSLKYDKNILILDLKQKIKSLYLEYEISQKQYEINLRTIANSKDNLISYNKLFKIGKKSWLDVLNIHAELINAQLSLSDLQSNIMTAPIKLKLYTGEFDIYDNLGNK